MHIHHLIRGGLFLTGVGIGSLCIAASAGAGSHGEITAPAADLAAVTFSAPEIAPPSAPLPDAPAATPYVIQAASAAPVVAEVAPVVPTTVVDAGEDEVEPGPGPAPEVPVIQAGPGPATPVPGAVTLIDPLVIEREAGAPTA
jgi:hypothetical protein